MRLSTELFEILVREEAKFFAWASTLGVDDTEESFILGMFWGELVDDFREEI